MTDELLSEYGAKRLAPAGYADAAKGNLYGDFEDWLDAALWPNLASGHVSDLPEQGMDIEISTNARASSLRYDVSLATVKENKVLTGKGEPTKCHMEIDLPSDTTYECGDYLALLPLNSEKNVKRIMAHFGLPWDAVVTVKSTGPSTIPANTPLSVFDVLRSYVELSQPATKKVCCQCREVTKTELTVTRISERWLRTPTMPKKRPPWRSLPTTTVASNLKFCRREQASSTC